jgi:hypothetical protein
MSNVKYVIVDGTAIVFPASIQHSDMVSFGQKCTGAGFVSFYVKRDEYGEDIIHAHCTGESYSLGVKAGIDDSEIVTRQITNSGY